MKKLATTLPIALATAMTVALAAGCAGAAMSEQEAAFNKLYQEAVEANDKAASVGGEWRDARDDKRSSAIRVGKKKYSNLGAAKAYAEQGDFKNAMKYAEIAKRQGMLGYEQAMEQRNAGPRH